MSVPTRNARSEAEFVESQCAVAQPVAGTATIFSCLPRLTAGIYGSIRETSGAGGKRLAAFLHHDLEAARRVRDRLDYARQKHGNVDHDQRQVRGTTRTLLRKGLQACQSMPEEGCRTGAQQP